MSTVFPSDPAGLTVDSMSTVSRSATGQMLIAGPAANADELGEARPKDRDATGAWDAYDVWRRLIKDARDRRKAQSEST
jgi:hypothetical protein